ncbi:Uncharacterised protein [uncultured archaeon]|nr:Uncharacterised protein [uncultured archaeon]
MNVENVAKSFVITVLKVVDAQPVVARIMMGLDLPGKVNPVSYLYKFEGKTF